jgi:hypothetical protein
MRQSKIARLAQDAAVIAGVNSSEAALGLTDALIKQRPILLKQYGIILSLEDVYNKQAKTLGKTRKELTATEKRQAFLNEMLRQGETIAGSYETAMEEVGKRITSLPRHFQAAQKAIGELFTPALRVAVDVAEEGLKTIKALAEGLKRTVELFGTKHKADFEINIRGMDQLKMLRDALMNMDLSLEYMAIRARQAWAVITGGVSRY